GGGPRRARAALDPAAAALHAGGARGHRTPARPWRAWPGAALEDRSRAPRTRLPPRPRAAGLAQIGAGALLRRHSRAARLWRGAPPSPVERSSARAGPAAGGELPRLVARCHRSAGAAPRRDRGDAPRNTRWPRPRAAEGTASRDRAWGRIRPG